MRAIAGAGLLITNASFNQTVASYFKPTAPNAGSVRDESISNTPPLKADSSSTVHVELSSTGQASLDGTTKAVNEFVETNGEAVFKNALLNPGRYPENYASVLDDPTTSREEKAAAREEMHARESRALDPFKSSGSEFARAYVEFYDSLSPEEQQSDRYRGTREPMAALANKESEGREDLRDMDKSQNPLLVLFEALDAKEFKIDPKDEKGFIERYRADTDRLLSRDLQSETISAALQTFRDIQEALELARDGDKRAFEHLRSLAEGSDALAGLSNYIDDVRAQQTTSKEPLSLEPVNLRI